MQVLKSNQLLALRASNGGLELAQGATIPSEQSADDSFYYLRQPIMRARRSWIKNSNLIVKTQTGLDMSAQICQVVQRSVLSE
jgi:hypothetical protein